MQNLLLSDQVVRTLLGRASSVRICCKDLVYDSGMQMSNPFFCASQLALQTLQGQARASVMIFSPEAALHVMLPDLLPMPLVPNQKNVEAKMMCYGGRATQASSESMHTYGRLHVWPYVREALACAEDVGLQSPQHTAQRSRTEGGTPGDGCLADPSLRDGAGEDESETDNKPLRELLSRQSRCLFEDLMQTC